jgi:hypothetical protein
LRVQNLNWRIVAFSKNSNKIGHISRIRFHLLTREIAGEGMDGREFTGTGSEELGAVVNGDGAMSEGYKELSVVASEGEEVWSPRYRE